MIGVFDSGIGGLTVLKALAMHFPEESFLYLGDTARLPYGTKSPKTIRKYSEQVMNYLITREVKALVIACNTASSQVSETHWQNIPVYTVIEPGSVKALSVTQNGKIGVLGTRATIQSEMYPQFIRALAKLQSREVEVLSQACPLFVPFAEEGLIDDPLTNLMAFRYLQPLLSQQIDTLILGCTHYPLLKTSLQRVCGAEVTLVDSGSAMCERLQQDFSSGALEKSSASSTSSSVAGSSDSIGARRIEILSTDTSSHIKSWAMEIMSPLPIDQFHQIDL